MLKKFIIITAILMVFPAVLYAGCFGNLVSDSIGSPGVRICVYQCVDGTTFIRTQPAPWQCPAVANK